MSRRITTRAIIFKDGKLLSVRLKQGRTISNDYWCTIGGGLDEGESLQDGLVREVIEETGVTPQVNRLLYIQQFIHKDVDYLEFFFYISNADDFESVDLSKTSHGVQEIEEIGFINPRTSGLKLLPVFLTTTDIAADIANSVSTPKIFSFVE